MEHILEMTEYLRAKEWYFCGGNKRGMMHKTHLKKFQQGATLCTFCVILM